MHRIPSTIYGSIHNWLKLNHGKAYKCENESCEKLSLIYEWAKLKDKSYDFNRENFWMLCKKCHKKYDCQFPIHHVEKKIYLKIKQVRLDLALELDEFCKLIDIP